MREEIITAIRNTFALESTADLKLLEGKPEVTAIKELPNLLNHVLDEKIPPKMIANALEAVVAPIKLKKEPTTDEKEFLHQIAVLVDEPMYSCNIGIQSKF